nr:uncharacterized protein LOC109762772 [Aegilops tauschii subsp. strangulata]
MARLCSKRCPCRFGRASQPRPINRAKSLIAPRPSSSSSHRSRRIDLACLPRITPLLPNLEPPPSPSASRCIPRLDLPQDRPDPSSRARIRPFQPVPADPVARTFPGAVFYIAMTLLLLLFFVLQ